MNVYDWKDGKLQLPASALPCLVPAEAGEAHAPLGAGLLPSAAKRKREYVQSFERANVVGKREVFQASREMFTNQLAKDERFVPVSFVAKDWKVTPRRIRALLAAGRLAGRLQDNGFWEVRYPYFLSLGTRGPVLKHQQRVAAKQERRAV